MKVSPMKLVSPVLECYSLDTLPVLVSQDAEHWANRVVEGHSGHMASPFENRSMIDLVPVLETMYALQFLDQCAVSAEILLVDFVWLAIDHYHLL